MKNDLALIVGNRSLYDDLQEASKLTGNNILLMLLWLPLFTPTERELELRSSSSHNGNSNKIYTKCI